MMKINLNALFERQRKFDEFIHKKHQLTYKKVFMETKLALFVELAELANEVKSFKFWSIKGSGPKEKILEEYLSGETGIREMERKYNINHSIIYRWLEN